VDADRCWGGRVNDAAVTKSPVVDEERTRPGHWSRSVL